MAAQSGPAFDIDATQPLIGISPIVRTFYTKGDITPVFEALKRRAVADPHDIAAMLDMSLILQSTGPIGLQIQAAAIGRQRLFRRIHGDGSGLRVLAFVTGGDP